MANVYIVNKGGHDYSDAQRFGVVQFLSEGPVSKYAVSKIYREFAMRMRGSGADDYILLTGLTTMACIACSCFSYIHGRLNLLIYKNGKYVERRLVLSELLTNQAAQEKQVAEILK